MNPRNSRLEPHRRLSGGQILGVKDFSADGENLRLLAAPSGIDQHEPQVRRPVPAWRTGMVPFLAFFERDSRFALNWHAAARRVMVALCA